MLTVLLSPTILHRNRWGWRGAALGRCGITQGRCHQLFCLTLKAECPVTAWWWRAKTHRNTSPKRRLLSRSSSSEYAPTSIQLAWEEKTHFVTVLLLLLLLTEQSCCPARGMIHWYQADSQAELAEDHRDRLASGWGGGWWGEGVTLTCCHLRASCWSSMLDDKRSHLHRHVKCHLCEACNNGAFTSDRCWFYSTVISEDGVCGVNALERNVFYGVLFILSTMYVHSWIDMLLLKPSWAMSNHKHSKHAHTEPTMFPYVTWWA